MNQPLGKQQQRALRIVEADGSVEAGREASWRVIDSLVKRRLLQPVPGFEVLFEKPSRGDADDT